MIRNRTGQAEEGSCAGRSRCLRPSRRERGVAKSGRTHKIRRAGGQRCGGRNEQKALCFVRTRPRMSAAFGGEAPGTTIPVPAEQNEVARIFAFSQNLTTSSASSPRRVSGCVRNRSGKPSGLSGFPVGMVPRDSAVGCTMQHTGNVPAFNEPASEGRLLRVINRFDKVGDGRPAP